MEILIVGGILVALMVYASTRIKKIAAQAYEREVVETEDFRLIKPEGFISPVNENSKFAFEARSKDLGDDESRDTPQAKMELSVFTDSNFEIVCENARKSAGKILAEDKIVNLAERNLCQLESEKSENDIAFYIFHKIVENPSRQKTYDLKISVLQDFREKYEEKINEVLSSFAVK
jgi:hypothetical protein